MKKIIISSQELKQGLAKLSRFVSSTAILPILESVLIQTRPDGYVYLSVTDLENYVSVRVTAEFTEQFSTTVDWKKLYDCASCVELQPLSLLANASEMEVVGDNFTIHLPIETSDNFPKQPSFSDNKYAAGKVVCNPFINALSVAVGYTSGDDLRPAMTGVYIHKQDADTVVVATDAHKLFYSGFHIEGFNVKDGNVFTEQGIIVRTKPINAMLDVLKKMEAREQMEIRYDETHINFRVRGIEIWSRLIDAKFPDYKVVLVNPDNVFYMKRDKMKAFLKLACKFVNPSTKKITLHVDPRTETMKAKGGDDEFLFGINYNMNVHQCNFTEEFEVALNVQFLMKALNATKDEYVKVRHSGQCHQAILIDEKVIVMPLMLNS